VSASFRVGHAVRALVGFALVLVAFAGCGSDRKGDSVLVPAVVGVNIAAAECVLARAGLHWRYAARIRMHVAQSESAACGGRYPIGENVCGQHPRAGSLISPDQVIALATGSTASRYQRRHCHAQRDRPDDPRAPILAVAFKYFRTAKVGEGGRACKLLTDRERARLERQPRGCPATLNKRVGGALIREAETVAVVLALDTTTGIGRASVRRLSIHGEPPIIRLRDQRGAWRIFDTGL
jgi:hypothetical protein